MTKVKAAYLQSLNAWCFRQLLGWLLCIFTWLKNLWWFTGKFFSKMYIMYRHHRIKSKSSISDPCKGTTDNYLAWLGVVSIRIHVFRLRSERPEKDQDILPEFGISFLFLQHSYEVEDDTHVRNMEQKVKSKTIFACLSEMGFPS